MNKDNNELEFKYETQKEVPLQSLTTNQLIDKLLKTYLHYKTSGGYTTALEEEIAITPIRLEIRRRCGVDYEIGGKKLCVRE